jgi:hypothetical protein
MVSLMAMTLSGGLNFVSAFAMHDSTLDVNTWIASNNSTQLQTTDLNKGPVSPTTSTAANTAQETTGPSVVTSNGDDGGNCDPSYPDDCIPSPPPDLDCGDNGVPDNVRVLQPDPHSLDGNDNDGVGCETGGGDATPDEEGDDVDNEEEEGGEDGDSDSDNEQED